jgi:hypothetical protein
VEVDRTEGKIQTVPEPESDHGKEQEPHPAVEPGKGLGNARDHPPMILAISIQ